MKFIIVMKQWKQLLGTWTREEVVRRSLVCALRGEAGLAHGELDGDAIFDTREEAELVAADLREHNTITWMHEDKPREEETLPIEYRVCECMETR